MVRVFSDGEKKNKFRVRKSLGSRHRNQKTRKTFRSKNGRRLSRLRQRVIPATDEDPMVIFKWGGGAEADIRGSGNKKIINLKKVPKVYAENPAKPLRIFSCLIFEKEGGWTEQELTKYFTDALDKFARMLDAHPDRFLIFGFAVNIKRLGNELLRNFIRHDRVIAYFLDLPEGYPPSYETTLLRFWPITANFAINGEPRDAVVYVRDAHTTIPTVKGEEDTVLDYFESTNAKFHMFNAPYYYPPHSMLESDIIAEGDDYIDHTTRYKIICNKDKEQMKKEDIGKEIMMNYNLTGNTLSLYYDKKNPVYKRSVMEDWLRKEYFQSKECQLVSMRDNDTVYSRDPRQIKRVLAATTGIRIEKDNHNINFQDFWNKIAEYKPEQIKYGIDEWFMTRVYYDKAFRNEILKSSPGSEIDPDSQIVSPIMWIFYMLKPALDIYKLQKFTRQTSEHNVVQIEKLWEHALSFQSHFSELPHALYTMIINFEFEKKVNLNNIKIHDLFNYIEVHTLDTKSPLYDYARLIPSRTEIWDFVWGDLNANKEVTLSRYLGSSILISDSLRNISGNGMEGKKSYRAFDYPITSYFHVRYGIQLQDLKRLSVSDLKEIREQKDDKNRVLYDVSLESYSSGNFFCHGIVKEFVNGRTIKDCISTYVKVKDVIIDDSEGIFVTNNAETENAVICLVKKKNYYMSAKKVTNKPQRIQIIRKLVDFYMELLNKDIKFYHNNKTFGSVKVKIDEDNVKRIYLSGFRDSSLFFKKLNSIKYKDCEEKKISDLNNMDIVFSLLKEYGVKYENELFKDVKDLKKYIDAVVEKWEKS